MLFEKFKEDGASLIGSAFQGVDPREIQIGLIKGGRDADALFETCDRLIPPLRAQVKHSEVVQGFGLPWPQLQSSLQILVRTIAVVELRKDHTQTVIGLRILRADLDRALQHVAGLVPLFLCAISVPEIVEGDYVIRTQLQSLLKVGNRFSSAAFSRSQET